MEAAPSRPLRVVGSLLEYTFEAETRPMIAFDPAALDELQRCAADSLEIRDPVFCLDESTGSVSAVFQVLAASVVTAVVIGSQLFTGCLILSGVIDSIMPLETVTASLFIDEDDIDGFSDFDTLHLLTGGPPT